MSFDPKSVLDDVIDILRTDVALMQSALTAAQRTANVREYGGEFRSEDVEWKFSAPAVFVQMLKASPRTFGSDGQPMDYDYEMVIFICHDASDLPDKTHVLTLAKQVNDALAGEVLTEGSYTGEEAHLNDEVMIQCGALDFLGGQKKMSVYTLDVKAIPS